VHLERKAAAMTTRLLAAMITTLLVATAAHATDVRLTWAHAGGAAYYRVFLAQPASDFPTISEHVVESPVAKNDGAMSWDVPNVDPSRPALFMMTAVGIDDRPSVPSNFITLEEQAFCPALDLDGDGKVTVLDALGLARRAVGAGGEVPDGNVTAALEALRVASSANCV